MERKETNVIVKYFCGVWCFVLKIKLRAVYIGKKIDEGKSHALLIANLTRLNNFVRATQLCQFN